VFSYNYLYQDHRNIETEKAEQRTTSQKIEKEFMMDAVKSEQKYLNKTIEVSGIISEINKNNLTLDEHILCVFGNPIDSIIKTNSNIKIKGRVIGYDDLFEQVKMDQCLIIK
jgi:hypothetical protein